MNRAIAFRIWDTQQSKWYTPVYRAYSGELHDLVINLDGSLSMRTQDGFIHESIFPDRYEVFRWTGLRDMNGAHIYEGDILQHHDHGYPVFGLCEWVERSAEFTPGIGLMSEHAEWLEVVGNIKETPELLKEQPHG